LLREVEAATLLHLFKKRHIIAVEKS
jgi:hypothetical protein